MNFSNLDIYTSRLLSAFCLFLILSQANLFLDSGNNTLLVLGYRFFILLTPLLFQLFQHRLTYSAFILAEVGLFAWLFHHPLAGTLLFATGISVSGYMLKYYSSSTTKGSAGNKIALNIGSILSGLILALSFQTHYILPLCGLALFISAITFSLYYRRANIAQLPTNQHHFSLQGWSTQKGIAWSLIGFVTGVKLISFVSILPQFLIQANQGQLPAWFGLLLITNSLFIVICQAPIMKLVKTLDTLPALLPLLLGMIVITLSPYLQLTSFMGCFVWTMLLSLVECAVSYLDTVAQRDEMLLIKEMMVGVGSAATVFLVRYLDPASGAVIIGVLSIVFMMLSGLLLTSPKAIDNILRRKDKRLQSHAPMLVNTAP